ncbi:MAG: ABC transporter substrate-binding protein [Peptostreptococcaceae bacterium]
MNKKIISLMVAGIVTVSLTGCTNKENKVESNESEYTITHELGETTLKEEPQRIAALEFSYVDALVSLDKEVVAIADDLDKTRIIEEVRSNLGEYVSLGSRRTPSLEALMEVSPDLIIADPLRHKDIQKELEQIAPTIYIDSTSVGYDEILSAFEQIGKAVGKEDEAKKLVEEHQNSMKKGSTSAQKLGTVAIGVVQDGMLSLQTDSSYVMESLKDFDITNITDSKDSRHQVTLEQLVDMNPDTLIIMTDEKDADFKQFKNNPLWNKLKAIENGNYYEVDRTLWLFSRGLISTEVMGEEFEGILNEAK